MGLARISGSYSSFLDFILTIMIHPNNYGKEVILYENVSLLDEFEVIQIEIEKEGASITLLLKNGPATIVVTKGHYISGFHIRWANRKGYELLGIPLPRHQSQDPSPLGDSTTG